MIKYLLKLLKYNGTDINYDLADYYLNFAKENGLKRAIDLYDARSKTK